MIPLFHKNKKVTVPNTLTCPRCGAPHQYLYDNTGGRGQFQCKVCSCNFNFKNYYSKAAILKCPHCSKTLEKIKERKDYFIFKCKNDNCSFYLHNLASTEKKVPVIIPELNDLPHMPARWSKLIKLSHDYLTNLNLLKSLYPLPSPSITFKYHLDGVCQGR